MLAQGCLRNRRTERAERLKSERLHLPMLELPGVARSSDCYERASFCERLREPSCVTVPVAEQRTQSKIPGESAVQSIGIVPMPPMGCLRLRRLPLSDSSLPTVRMQCSCIRDALNHNHPLARPGSGPEATNPAENRRLWPDSDPHRKRSQGQRDENRALPKQLCRAPPEANVRRDGAFSWMARQRRSGRREYARRDARIRRCRPRGSPARWCFRERAADRRGS